MKCGSCSAGSAVKCSDMQCSEVQCSEVERREVQGSNIVVQCSVSAVWSGGPVQCGGVNIKYSLVKSIYSLNCLI